MLFLYRYFLPPPSHIVRPCCQTRFASGNIGSSTGFGFPNRRLGFAARPYPHNLDAPRRRFRLQPALGFNQTQGLARLRSPISLASCGRGSKTAERIVYLAAAFLGTPNPRRIGLPKTYGLHSFQSCQTRLGGFGSGLAVFHLPPPCSEWYLSCRLGRGCRYGKRRYLIW